METRIRRFLSATGYFVFVVFAVACSVNRKPKSPVIVEKVPCVSAKELAETYRHDLDSADSKYTFKVVAVTGTIVEIGTATDSEVIVAIVYRTEDNEVVQIFFKREISDEVAKFTKGMTVTAQGRCLGKAGPYISLTNCSVKL